MVDEIRYLLLVSIKIFVLYDGKRPFSYDYLRAETCINLNHMYI